MSSLYIFSTLSHHDLFLGTTLLGACVILYWFLPFVYGLTIAPTRKLPGPFLARITRWFEFHLVFRGDSNLTYIRLHEQFGPVVRMGPNRYSFSDPSDVKMIYELGGKSIKSRFYEPLLASDPEKQNIFTMRDPIRHKDRRRKIANLYSMSTMVAYESAVDKMNSVCVSKLSQFAKEKRKISLPDFMQYYAFDVIGEITFSKSFGMMENEGDSTGMIKGIHGANGYLAHAGIIPDIHPWFMRFQSLMGKSQGANMLLEFTFNQLSRNRQANAKEGNVSTSDSFLAKLMQLESENRVTMPHILDSCGSNIAAGSDTTAISLSSALFYLYSNADKLAKLRDEIDTMAEKGLISDPVTFQQAQTMPYLQAVIKESLRIHPAVGTILPRVAPQGGLKLAGTYIPEGTEVGANAWVLHYSKNIFGEDAAVYRPERWLEPKDENDVRESMMFAFGGGSRSCLGKNISLLEMTKVLPQIVRKFDFNFDHTKAPNSYCAWFVYLKYVAEPRLRATK
ncbi:cytochrome P450 [Dendryphion nanum]|uniref:Cytochrome P450 n=1 Tax=Dendryphion nanum TaxID=256645 RepID=A0A9P9D403_9PLEO|nr:cytochrome P450 [Dendryphion nanum]